MDRVKKKYKPNFKKNAAAKAAAAAAGGYGGYGGYGSSSAAAGAATGAAGAAVGGSSSAGAVGGSSSSAAAASRDATAESVAAKVATDAEADAVDSIVNVRIQLGPGLGHEFFTSPEEIEAFVEKEVQSYKEDLEATSLGRGFNENDNEHFSNLLVKLKESFEKGYPKATAKAKSDRVKVSHNVPSNHFWLFG